MILELDCGNSFIKWRITAKNDAAVISGGVVDSDAALLMHLSNLPDTSFTDCRLVSVRSAEETARLVSLLADTFSVAAVCAEPAQELAGVINGYDDFARLGLDRWLAFVGAYHLARSACLVIDLGTAVTSDFVDAGGAHLGGFICPGMPLMRNQLRTHTRRIRYDDTEAEKALARLVPGRATAEAVERGCSLMLRGFALTQIEIAQGYWGNDFAIFVTGGDAALVADVLPGARIVPDLVFVGLALACPLR
ncbi:pantothenate kinase [Pseudomonas amygdali pv. tabaci str. ATCC 11528]|uniref:Type III pantothenate kinase n=1 Tax=Pseudomonas amygdali pv. hibisci TaxID=251723 RepID=A0AB34U9F5_PSEA0|nr:MULTISPECIES: pantothenate kinase [Pseudomonas syringae group]KEZ69217.1 pantothenate kinase [Pseudomonas amygdali pv. tabaci str. ATCC 11528]KKY51643.1 pantothenate kinase [Pseudomonas amygdali pv. tabaci str. ATCC 11528]KPX56234.1 Type III pantothenate kinase [Pseudomonas amygdali pv. hibisci]MDU8604467.1 pantothenate kinase [Pseudomonas syringae group sp. 247E2]MDU8629538.1 pantothenate kinase [Pseudomonas syringae group sp. 243L2]